eukprot:Skav234105  [mRNA]  locus=scaffold2732:34784:36676:+ [translate_table: standard]
MQLATPVPHHLPPQTAWTLSVPVIQVDRKRAQHVQILLALLPAAGLRFRRGHTIPRRQRMQRSPTLSEISLTKAPSESTDFREAEEFLGIELHPWQRDIAQAALAGKDSSVYMGTGSGKSVCFQLPALVSGKVVIAVSPLIALMKEQVQKFNETAKKQGSAMKACFLGSGHENAARKKKMDEAALRGTYNLIYITPEKLAQSSTFLSRLRKLVSKNRIALLAVDEAHCISEWGGEFRPCYRELVYFREDYPKVPIMSLTAIKTPQIKYDIEYHLELRDSVVREGTAHRSNLMLKRSQPLPGLGDLERVAEEARREGDRTIIYVNQRKDAEKVGAKLKDILKSSDVSVGIYHAEIDQRNRDAAHDDFSDEGAHIMVATVAYGLGIDFPNVRRLYHLGAPTSVERYYQQIGRAGRDGKPAVCELIASDSDFAKVREPNAKEEEWQKRSFKSMRHLIHTPDCLWNHLLQYMGEEPLPGGCGSCDVCKAKEQLDTGIKDATRQSKVFFEAVRIFEDEGKPMCFTKIANLICDNKASKTEFKGARYRKTAAHLKETCNAMGLRVQTKVKKFYQSLVPILVSNDYLRRRSKQFGPWFKRRQYEVYLLRDKANEVLEGDSEVRLQIPPSCQELHDFL